jgi:A/G-specific adenine glycosylase
LSQAFDAPLPILEANSQRVLCRLLGLRADPRRGAGRRMLWDTAAVLVPRRGAGAFNQALMELGARVCTPDKPACEECPLTGQCEARRLGLQHAIPPRAPEPEIEQVREVAVVIRRGGRVLLVQRPGHGRWAGMWEFAHTALQNDEDHGTAATRLLRDVLSIRADVGRELTTIRHGITRFRITMVCLDAAYRAGRFASPFYQNAKWTTLSQLRNFPVSSPQRRLIQTLSADRQESLF